MLWPVALTPDKQGAAAARLDPLTWKPRADPPRSASRKHQRAGGERAKERLSQNRVNEQSSSHKTGARDNGSRRMRECPECLQKGSVFPLSMAGVIPLPH
ncbi:hypothetical protein AAFF_G00078970 [Aldrovandia affinis]|uniref:Uncharacterized protein n=1 Tax=Aldrovandia affinis TaxID=143900 RepID=A0AAD7RZX7_9TELE|nr:hypothetical protein AAFF_G00078970 [Aldrovandia affinis]